MSESGLFSSTIFDCSVALNDVEDSMMDSVEVGLKYGEPSVLNTGPSASGETNSIQVSLTPAAQCKAGFEPYNERPLAEQKSPVLTVQTTQPA